jgi:hypothetical protein
MVSNDALGLPVVDALALDEPVSRLLMPGALMRTRNGDAHVLPRFFYQVDSWHDALETQLTPHFGLWELMDVDLHEAAPLRLFPRYVPCAVTSLAAALEVFRLEVGATVRITANGGYRSPTHHGSRSGSPHCWGTAANIYAIGGAPLDTEEQIGRYAAVARRLLPFAWVRPYGHGPGEADDHLHLDLGYVTTIPNGTSEHHDGGAAARA